MSKNSKENNDLMAEGLGIGLTFIVLGVFIQFVFWGNDIALWGATFSIAIGITALGFQLEENKDPKTGLDDIGLGILFFLPSFLGVFYFSNTFIKILFFLPLVIGLFGIISGSIKQIQNNPSTKTLHSNDTTTFPPRKLISFMVSLTGFLSNIVTILTLFIR